MEVTHIQQIGRVSCTWQTEVFMRRTLILMLTMAPLLLGQMPVTRKPKASKNPVTWIRRAVAAETALAERFSGWGIKADPTTKPMVRKQKKALSQLSPVKASCLN